MPSPLVRGAWIEKLMAATKSDANPSPLVRGAWIEKLTPETSRTLLLVAPRERGVD